MKKHKKGFILLVAAGITAPLLYFSVSTPGQQSRQVKSTRSHQNVLHQIPPRIRQKSSSEQTEQQAADSKKTSQSDIISSEMLSQLSADEVLARLVGKWEQTKSTSKQILTINENGTATMEVEPQGIWSAVLGAKVTINIEWSLKNATLTLKTVGGSPQNKLDYINQLWGSEFVREIHTIEDKMFTLRNDSGHVGQKWVRKSY